MGMDFMPAFIPSGLGWRPDLPDPRDYQPDRADLEKVLGRLKRQSTASKRADWREYCPPADDRTPVEAGVARACVALLQYFERRATGEIIEPSTSFLDYTSRRMLACVDARQAKCLCHDGEQLRAAWKAIVRFGVPRVQDWPSAGENFGREPDAFAYAAALKFPGMHYVRLDGGRQSAEAVLESIKSFLAAGFALVFGFSVCTSVTADADIPYSTIFDGIRGGRAAMAVGYDDNRQARSWRGALLITPFWGNAWGEGSYGWLPYCYVTAGLAVDFWTLVRTEWLASGEFERPA